MRCKWIVRCLLPLETDIVSGSVACCNESIILLDQQSCCSEYRAPTSDTVHSWLPCPSERSSKSSRRDRSTNSSPWFRPLLMKHADELSIVWQSTISKSKSTWYPRDMLIVRHTPVLYLGPHSWSTLTSQSIVRQSTISKSKLTSYPRDIIDTIHSIGIRWRMSAVNFFPDRMLSLEAWRWCPRARNTLKAGAREKAKTRRKNCVYTSCLLSARVLFIDSLTKTSNKQHSFKYE